MEKCTFKVIALTVIITAFGCNTLDRVFHFNELPRKTETKRILVDGDGEVEYMEMGGFLYKKIGRRIDEVKNKYKDLVDENKVYVILNDENFKKAYKEIQTVKQWGENK